jgi:hypothetical protein
MTCTLNEAACIAFTVGAVIDHVDLYVLIDTGSDDGTPDLVCDLYPGHVRSGRLVVDRIGRLPGHDMSIARNRALDRLRAGGITHFIKLDGDTVFYDDGIRATIENMRGLSRRVTVADCGTHELYQHEIEDTPEWILALREGRDLFFEFLPRPMAPLIHAVQGARARGAWGDEYLGRPAEGIFYDRPHVHRTFPDVVAAHYGWARPLRAKRAKLAAQNIPADDAPFLDTAHLVEEHRQRLRPFSDHPEIIARKVDAVHRWLSAAGRQGDMP